MNSINPITQQTILVTGGAGFIGSHLCRKLLEEGNSVICVDNFITGFRKNIEELESNSNFKLIEQDISNPLHIEEGLDWVLHFASLASPKHYLNYPIETLKAGDRKSTRLNSSHTDISRMPSSA